MVYFLVFLALVSHERMYIHDKVYVLAYSGTVLLCPTWIEMKDQRRVKIRTIQIIKCYLFILLLTVYASPTIIV